MDWLGIVAGGLGILAVVLGTKLTRVKIILSEFSDIPETIALALDDNKVTKDELKAILKECGELIEAIKGK